MPITDPERLETAAELGRLFSRTGQPCAITKPDLKAAVDAVDAWCDANQASFVNAIPLPARTALTASQKSWLLCYVVRMRIADLG